MPLTVGTPSAGYAYRRNIVDAVPNTRYRLVVDANRILTGTAKLLSSIVNRPPFELTSLRNTVRRLAAPCGPSALLQRRQPEEHSVDNNLRDGRAAIRCDY
jgi:hypothetical protein